MTEQKTKIYFPGLNALRFFAAFLVLVSHVEQLKGLFGYKNYYDIPAIHQVGNLAVTFFFVLSGFLITYLLFVERDSSNTVSVKNFYIRRLLRIWPLYYLILFLGLFLLPQIAPFLYTPELTDQLYSGFGWKVLLFLVFLPQVVLISFPRSMYIEPSWSIGVEEQFYLIWPVLFKFFPHFLKLMIVLIIILFSIKLGAFLINHFSSVPDIQKVGEFVRDYFYFARFQCMIAGGLGAYVLYYRKELLQKFIFSKYFQWGLYALLFVLLLSGYSVPRINHEFYSVFFLLIILNIAANPASIVKLEVPVFNYLGKISYGIYMFHELAIGLSIYFLAQWALFTGIAFESLSSFIALYILSLLLTIGIAAFSYKFIEMKFLKLKINYSTVVSGESAKEAPSKIKETA